MSTLPRTRPAPAVRSRTTAHKGLVHVASRLGHRAEYLELLAATFGLMPSEGMVGRRNLLSLLRAEALLFATIDDDYRGFFLVAQLRAALGRRTAGLFLRPQTCFDRPGLPYRAKRHAFALPRRLSPVSVFTILPFSVAPEFAEIADDGLIDPQLWDRPGSPAPVTDPALSTEIAAAARGRRILAFLGTAHSAKGIGFLAQLMADPGWPHDEILVIAGGHFPPDTAALAKRLEQHGALVLPRFLSEAELATLYARADLIWACYRPDYDQASGIFGRAVQLSRMPVVRAGSRIARLARQSGLAVVELEYDSPDAAARLRAALTVASPGDAAQTCAGWKADFIDRLGRAL